MDKTVDFKIVEEPKKPIAMHPKKFGVWLFMASVMMLFMSLTSAYIVRRAEGNWVYFELPRIFYYSTFIVIAGSITMQIAFLAAKRNLIKRLRLFLGISFVISLTFLVTQYLGLVELVNQGHYFTGGNPSESFFYVFPWLHGVHIVSAIIFLLIVWRSAVKEKINSNDTSQIEMCTTYWHFLGVLWVYLFVFLSLLR